MGSFTSKDFDDLVEDTPSTPLSGKRVLTFDPRSPSGGITRTPIQVEKTPDRLIDPRSPTCGILRTPILNCEFQKGLFINKSPTSSLISSPDSSEIRRRHSFSEGSPVRFDPLSVTDMLACLPSLDADIDDCSDGIQLIKRSTSEPELTVLEDLPAEYPQKALSKKPVRSVKQRKPKAALFQSNTNTLDVLGDMPRSPLRILSESQPRSPLNKRNNVDVNSPRNIVQRKQSNKLGLLKSKGTTTPNKSGPSSPCRFEAMTVDDKENISM